MSRMIVLLIGFFAFISLPAHGADCFKPIPKKHSIDIWEKKEMAKTEGVTVNILNVQASVYGIWDKELNRAYKNLMSKLPKDTRLALRESQRNWLKFRDSEDKLVSDDIYNQGGTISTIIDGESAKNILRTRVLQLQSYIKAIDCPP